MGQTKIKKVVILLIIFFVFLALVLSFVFRSRIFGPGFFQGGETPEVGVDMPQQQEPESTFLDGDIFSEPEAVVKNEKESLLKSENYKIRQIAFGGGSAAPIENLKEVPVSIVNLQSEALLSPDNKEAKLLISWDTNKEVVSTVEYSGSGGDDVKKLAEGKYGTSHRLVLSGLDPGAVYIYQIKSRDRWGRDFISEYYSVYSGSPAVSVFDLISRSMNEIFGWAIKK